MLRLTSLITGLSYQIRQNLFIELINELFLQRRVFKFHP